MIRTIAAAFALTLAAAPVLAAEPLTEDQVTRFVATLQPVEEFGDRLDDEGKMNEFDDRAPVPGKEFHPYSDGVATLKKAHPADYARLGDLLKPHGFSQDQWAATGDRVMLAYMAIRMEKENPDYDKQMAKMDPAMLAQMPAPMRAQMEGVMAMIETVKKAPAADKAAVKPHVKAIEKEIGE